MKIIGKEYTNKMERIAFLKDNCDKVVENLFKDIQAGRIAAVQGRVDDGV